MLQIVISFSVDLFEIIACIVFLCPIVVLFTFYLIMCLMFPIAHLMHLNPLLYDHSGIRDFHSFLLSFPPKSLV